MKQTTLRANLLLLITALIWGTTFVAQRIGMDHIGPMAYNGARFLLGTLVLLPLIINRITLADMKTLIKPTAIAGTIVFFGSALQQYALVHTTAGKAGFITGLYVILVPMLGLFIKIPARTTSWLGAMLAATGLYLLSVTKTFTIQFGDLLVLISALFWATHLLVISHYSTRTNPIALACGQFLFCSLLSFICAFLTEDVQLSQFQNAAQTIAYGGILSVGIAYTLQVIAQKDADPTHAAIILCLEAVFAAAAGWWVLGEVLDNRSLLGCGLMLLGMIVAQMPTRFLRRPRVPAT